MGGFPNSLRSEAANANGSTNRNSDVAGQPAVVLPVQVLLDWGKRLPAPFHQIHGHILIGVVKPVAESIPSLAGQQGGRTHFKQVWLGEDIHDLPLEIFDQTRGGTGQNVGDKPVGPYKL